MTDTMEEYFEALENWAEARSSYRLAFREYDGPSPDWALHRPYEKYRAATEALKDAFANAVRSVVQESV